MKPETTGQRIQQARKAAGLSQKELGRKLGVSGSMVGQYENNLRNPKLETLQRIAGALSADAEWLRTGNSSTTETEQEKDIEVRKLNCTEDITVRQYIKKHLKPNSCIKTFPAQMAIEMYGKEGVSAVRDIVKARARVVMPEKHRTATEHDIGMLRFLAVLHSIHEKEIKEGFFKNFEESAMACASIMGLQETDCVHLAFLYVMYIKAGLHRRMSQEEAERAVTGMLQDYYAVPESEAEKKSRAYAFAIKVLSETPGKLRTVSLPSSSERIIILYTEDEESSLQSRIEKAVEEYSRTERGARLPEEDRLRFDCSAVSRHISPREQAEYGFLILPIKDGVAQGMLSACTKF